MPFDFSNAKMKAGHTIPMVLDMLPGAPVVHLEHLGIENKTLLEAQVLAATAAATAKPTPKRGKPVAGAEAVAAAETALREEIAKMRRELHHAIRHLEAFHTDTGLAATDEDIPDFIAALPDDVVERIYRVASNAEHFRRPSADPRAIAGKS